MCGRFTVTTSKFDKWISAFPNLIARHWQGPRFNIAPTQPVPAVLAASPDEICWIRWGLVPHWAKDVSIGSRLVNARAETLSGKPAFRQAFARQRCLILADGFYEWVTLPGTRVKKPYYIRMKSREPFTFAGLWDRWEGPGGALLSCTIITTRPNALIAPLHDRMPAIIPAADRGRWLHAAAPPGDLLAPFAPDAMEAFAVSTAVNSPAHDTPDCIAPPPPPLPELF